MEGCRNFLEIGSGEGFCTRSIVHWSGGTIDRAEGFDLDAAKVKKAGKLWTKEGTIRYRVADAQRTFPYGDGAFDAIIILDVLEHVIDPGFVIRESKRIVRKGGMIFVVVPCEGEKGTLHARLRRDGWDASLKYGGHIQAFKKSEIISLIKAEGLAIGRIQYSAHWFGQITDYVGFEIKKYTEMDRQSKLDPLRKLKLFLMKKCMKTWMQKLSYFESRLLSACSSSAMDMNIRCSES